MLKEKRIEWALITGCVMLNDSGRSDRSRATRVDLCQVELNAFFCEWREPHYNIVSQSCRLLLSLLFLIR